jgi:hypothetical protein
LDELLGMDPRKSKQKICICKVTSRFQQSLAQISQILRKHVITINKCLRVSSQKSKKLDLDPKSRGIEEGFQCWNFHGG